MKYCKSGLVLAALAVISLSGVLNAAPPTPPEGGASAEYDRISGILKLTSDGAVNVYLESLFQNLMPGATDPAPDDTLISMNNRLAGLTSLSGVVTNSWTADVGAFHGKLDLVLRYVANLGDAEVSSTPNNPNFLYISGPADPGIGQATAQYNRDSGEFLLSMNGAINAFVESFSASLVPGDIDPAPPGALTSHNNLRSGLTGVEGINVNYWSSNIGPGHERADLLLKVTSELGDAITTYRADTDEFRYVPEPSSLGMCLLGLIGLVAARRRS